MSPLLLATFLAAAPTARPAPPSIPSNPVNASAPATVGAALGEAEKALDARASLPEVAVPFACGARFPVSQGHATGSHLSYDTYAWDFRMPEGTPITAARDGVVRMARGDSRQGGCDPAMAAHANYVVLEHGDELETQYLHFSRVVVKPGDKVRTGQLLGYSGNTGWSCGPHLHFKVARRQGTGWNNPSLPALLVDHGDPVRGTLVSAAACEPSAQPQFASQDAEDASPVVDVAVGASLPGGPVNPPTSALGGTAAPSTPAAARGGPARTPSPANGSLPTPRVGPPVIRAADAPR